MTPTGAELRELIDQAAITQARAAELCHASLRTMQQWLAAKENGSRRMPRATMELFVMALVAHGYIDPGPWMSEWVRPQFLNLIRAWRPMTWADSKKREFPIWTGPKHK